MNDILKLLSLYNNEKNKQKKKEIFNEILNLVNITQNILNKKLISLEKNEKRNNQ